MLDLAWPEFMRHFSTVVKPTPLAYALAVARIVAGVAGARLRRDRVSPFFDAGGRPLRAPHVITREERAALQ